jgi:hypothetical protein
VNNAWKRPDGGLMRILVSQALVSAKHVTRYSFYSSHRAYNARLAGFGRYCGTLIGMSETETARSAFNAAIRET